MTLSELATLLTTIMFDGWTDGSIPIVYDNQPLLDLSDNTVWGRFTVRFGNQRQTAMGQSKMTEQLGRVYLQIFVKKGEGSGQALDAANVFTELFRYYRSTETGYSLAMTAPDIDTFDNEDWYQMNVSIPFTATFMVSTS